MQAVVSPLESESLIGLDLAAVLQTRIKQGHALVGIAVERTALYTQQVAQQFTHLVFAEAQGHTHAGQARARQSEGTLL